MMTDLQSEKLERFLRELEEALGPNTSQRAEILTEVRADLEAHVERFRKEGNAEEEAIDLALAEMGNPYELAHHVRGEIPPFGGRMTTVVRYIAAGALVLWTLCLLYNVRPWSYGFDPLSLGFMLLFHLPGILLLWPRIIWRKNWLFGLIPAGGAVLVCMFIALIGTRTEMTYELPEEGAVTEITELTAGEPPKIFAALVVSALAGVAVVLFLAMQQRTQRRIAFVALAGTCLLVEIPFQVEEYLFRKDRDRVAAYLDTVHLETGKYPTRETFEAEGPELISDGSSVYTNEDDFSIFWNRPLNPGYAIVYAFKEGTIRIQD